ncbi:240aa long hypothetical protein [Pyrococcus horikoshii OT3]|uniref:Uncharacterized protein n=1 Tax=Pyrococcus horikoshii (strain ATCC 700860 / DSM 12428 / JCM 9974 / NBRC 100139 / OT-3) TaxID=70601 RepID=O58899_PYRHO|nr:240aa long hypothetical protein [Pyrococcus horikoshii OT3]
MIFFTSEFLIGVSSMNSCNDTFLISWNEIVFLLSSLFEVEQSSFPSFELHTLSFNFCSIWAPIIYPITAPPTNPTRVPTGPNTDPIAAPAFDAAQIPARAPADPPSTLFFKVLKNPFTLSVIELNENAAAGSAYIETRSISIITELARAFFLLSSLFCSFSLIPLLSCFFLKIEKSHTAHLLLNAAMNKSNTNTPTPTQSQVSEPSPIGNENPLPLLSIIKWTVSWNCTESPSRTFKVKS